jgi:hypothetical protein
MNNIAKANGYATQENAMRKLKKVLDQFGIERINYLIAVNDAGRFVPCVLVNGGNSDLASLCHWGITVIG